MKKIKEDGFMTFYFFLATNEGYNNQAYYDELKHIVIVKEYSYKFVKQILHEKVTSKITDLSDKQLLKYLHSNFNFDDD